MPAGIARSPFLVPLAKSLKMSPQSIRDRLNKGGYPAPYLDEPRALKILETQGVNVAKYRASKAVKSYRANGANDEQANGHDESKTALVVATTASGPPPPPSTPTQTLPVVASATDATSDKIAKLRAAWANKLIPRLARLLPEGDSPKGKKRIKALLKDGGYVGPRWDDEARAIGILRAAGLNVEGFEWKNPANESRIPVTRSQVEDVTWKLGQAEKARTMLEQFERAWFDEVYLGNLPRQVRHPMTYAFDALNELRAKRPK